MSSEDPASETFTLNIHRPVFKQTDFNKAYQTGEPSHRQTVWSAVTPLLKSYDPRKLLSLFSILNVICGFIICILVIKTKIEISVIIY
jgi:hypothetical protein